MIRIAVINQKGGVGKTTTVINLASYLAKAGRAVTIIDFDPQGNATSGLGLDKKAYDETIYDALVDGLPVSSVLQETKFDNIFIAPSNQQLAGAEVELASSSGREAKLKLALKDYQGDIVLIDCPPSLGLLTLNALVAADYVLIPVQTEYYALEGLAQLIDIVQKVKAGFNSGLSILGIVMTMMDSRTILAEQVSKEVIKHFGDIVFKTVIPRNVKVAEAPSHGVPLSDYDKWSKGARAYKQLSKEVLSRVKAK